MAVTAVPAATSPGVPLRPEDVPGAAVSPGSSTWSWTAAPAFTASAELAPVREPPEAVTVCPPAPIDLAVRKVTEAAPDPATRAALAGSTALASVEVTATVGVALVTRFHQASTATTVTGTGAPAVAADGEPERPVEDPGDAVSPGSSSRYCENVPALTVSSALVPGEALGEPVDQVAVTDRAPALLKAIVRVPLPLASVRLAGNGPPRMVAFASVEVMATVEPAELTTFQ